jgi:alpha-1,3-rhamnosyl/mannosyltransferase
LYDKREELAMRIAIDGRVINPHFPGIGRYVYHLVDALATESPDLEIVLLHDPARFDQRFSLSALARHEGVRPVAVPVGTFSPATQWKLPTAIRSTRADVYHATYWVTPYRPRVPTALSLYDVIGLRMPDAVPPVRRCALAVALRLAVRSADVILTLSESSKADLVAAGLATADRVVVTHLGVDERFRPPGPDEVADLRGRLDLPETYVLYVGINKPHKNLSTLIEAWARLCDEGESASPVHDSDAALVIAGPWDERYEEPREQAAAMSAERRVVFAGQVDEADLPALYGGATVFAFPSRVEGFGLPPLEAMACGTPVVASNATSLPEVIGDAGRLVDPNDVERWTEALRSLLENRETAEELARRGLERAARFTWQRTARGTLEAYQAIHRQLA